MFVNLAVVIRFVFYPFFTVNGHVRPLMINLNSIQPLRINLIPFVNILDYDNKREAAINIIGNICMFIPTGIILPILYPRLDRFWKVLLAGAGLSLVIEMMQLFFPGSVSDIDDLILNTAGVAIGYGIYKLVHRFRQKA
jgi:glycopeptide antibiotics resistance protein